MRITPQPITIDLLATDLVRHPGLHASHIYGGLFQELEPKRFVKGSLPNPLRMALGTAWETHLEYLLLKGGVKAERPEQFRSPEGVTYSPDLIMTAVDDVLLGEIKLTWMSSRDMPRRKNESFPPKFDKYLSQMMLYGHWLDIDLGWLCVFFVNGSDRFTPELLAWRIEFSRREKIENYDRLMQYAKTAKLL